MMQSPRLNQLHFYTVTCINITYTPTRGSRSQSEGLAPLKARGPNHFIDGERAEGRGRDGTEREGRRAS